MSAQQRTRHRVFAINAWAALACATITASAEETTAPAATLEQPHHVYKATPPQSASPPPATNAGHAAEPMVAPAAAGSHAPVDEGPGIEIITGGASSDGSAKVGHLPIIQ